MVTRTPPEWRRIAVLTGDHRYDLAIPLDDSWITWCGAAAQIAYAPPKFP